MTDITRRSLLVGTTAGVSIAAAAPAASAIPVTRSA